LEIDLVYNVRPCGTCDYFWPDDLSKQPYGPFPVYDFDSNTPKTNSPDYDGQYSFAWVSGTTGTQAFPNAEIMDGCRKAPIMTIGINPNLTAFETNPTGAAWCYPDFSSDENTDAATKYAFYYRYRTVYQERLDLDFIKQHLLEDGQIVAEKPGEVVPTERPSDLPDFDLKIRYDGDDKDTVIPLKRDTGTPRYVVLVDSYAPHNRIDKGDVIAARLDVPAGQAVEVYQQQIGYYEQFVPVLQRFENFLQGKGHQDAKLRMGEDVCQLDMVACASPHWKPKFLGGSRESEDTIINNCVARNAWAMKQFVQTRPAVLFLVGESSYNMFHKSFGKLIQADPPLPDRPVDGAFTLFRATTDDQHPVLFKFSTEIDVRKYSISTRLVVSPHFSYNSNFLPQFRMSRDEWSDFEKAFADCAKFLQTDSRIEYEAPSYEGAYLAYTMKHDPADVWEDLSRNYNAAVSTLLKYYYNPHKTMAEVLAQLYDSNTMTYTAATKDKSGYLTRTEGSCQFCVNEHWEFPLGCPYDKEKETPPPVGFLEKVAEAIVKAGN
jgi:hypothetical protein